jgi:molecular chaperone DnaK (HSP70)
MVGRDSTYRLGIDLGTTYTAAAVARGDGTQMVPLGIRTPEIPSVVAVMGDEVLVGDAAQRQAPGSSSAELATPRR